MFVVGAFCFKINNFTSIQWQKEKKYQEPIWKQQINLFENAFYVCF